MYGHFIRATWPGWRPCLCLGHSPCSSSCGSELTEMSPPQRALPDWPHLKQPSGCPSPHCFSFVSVSAWQSSHSCEKQFVSLSLRVKPKLTLKPASLPPSPAGQLWPQRPCCHSSDFPAHSHLWAFAPTRCSLCPEHSSSQGSEAVSSLSLGFHSPSPQGGLFKTLTHLQKFLYAVNMGLLP